MRIRSRGHTGVCDEPRRGFCSDSVSKEDFGSEAGVGVGEGGSRKYAEGKLGAGGKAIFELIRW